MTQSEIGMWAVHFAAVLPTQRLLLVVSSLESTVSVRKSIIDINSILTDFVEQEDDLSVRFFSHNFFDMRAPE